MIENIKKNKSVIDFQITMNKKCNLRCNHCYLDNYIDNEIKYSTLKKIFIYIEELLKQNKFLIKEFDITILGGEITLIKNNKKFYYIFKKTELLIKKYKNIKIKILLFSNFIKPFNQKMLLLINNFSLNYKNNLFVVSSFESDTDRFKNDKVYKLWKNNLLNIKNLNKNIKLVNSLTMTKGTVDFIQTKEYLEILEIFDYIEYELLITNEKTLNLKPKYKNLIDLFIFQYKNNKKYKGSNYNKDGIGFDKEYINKFNISPTGKIDFDNVIYEKKELNINNDTIEDCLNAFYKNTNDKIINNFKYILKNCNKCEFLNKCCGGYYIYRNENENTFSFDDRHICPGFYQLRKHLIST